MTQQNRLFSVERLDEMLSNRMAVTDNYPDYWELIKQLADTMRENERLLAENAILKEYHNANEYLKEVIRNKDSAE